MQVTVTISRIDLDLLRKQKRVLLKLSDKIQKTSTAEPRDGFTQDDADVVEGMIALCDAIQEYAVKVLGIDKHSVMDLTPDPAPLDKNGNELACGYFVDAPDPEEGDNWTAAFNGNIVYFDPEGYAMVERYGGETFKIKPNRLEISF